MLGDVWPIDGGHPVDLGYGERVADFNSYHKAGKGRLFFWRDVLLKDYGKGESMMHKWTIDPIPDGKGEFRIGAICTATIKPEAGPTARLRRG